MAERIQRYTATSGEVIAYPSPSADVANFLARVIAAANDPRVSEAELTELVYGRENPLLDQGIFPGRGAVTPEVFANPLNRVFTDLITRKSILKGAFVPSRHEQGTDLIDRTGSPAVEPSEPALRVRCGSAPGRSLRIKGAEMTVTGKRGSVVDIEARTFERVIVATSGESTQHVFELEPADEPGRIAWGPFLVEGRFRVAREITNTRDASAAWHGFGSILPSVVLEAIDSWVRNEPESRNERDAWHRFEAQNAELLRPLAKALRSRARTEFLDRVRGQ